MSDIHNGTIHFDDEESRKLADLCGIEYDGVPYVMRPDPAGTLVLIHPDEYKALKSYCESLFGIGTFCPAQFLRYHRLFKESGLDANPLRHHHVRLPFPTALVRGPEARPMKFYLRPENEFGLRHVDLSTSKVGGSDTVRVAQAIPSAAAKLMIVTCIARGVVTEDDVVIDAVPSDDEVIPVLPLKLGTPANTLLDHISQQHNDFLVREDAVDQAYVQVLHKVLVAPNELEARTMVVVTPAVCRQLHALFAVLTLNKFEITLVHRRLVARLQADGIEFRKDSFEELFEIK